MVNIYKTCNAYGSSTEHGAARTLQAAGRWTLEAADPHDQRGAKLTDGLCSLAMHTLELLIWNVVENPVGRRFVDFRENIPISTVPISNPVELPPDFPLSLAHSRPPFSPPTVRNHVGLPLVHHCDGCDRIAECSGVRTLPDTCCCPSCSTAAEKLD